MSKGRDLLREPFAHFLALGAALFILSWALGHLRSPVQTIVVSAGDIAHLSSMWQTQYKREPTEEEMKALIAQHIEEEILFREAKKLNLDADDIIIRRRLVQKYTFLFEENLNVPEPEPEALQQYFGEHSQNYRLPPTFTFRHIYFTGADGEARAKEALQQLSDADVPQAWRTLGDPFMMQREFAETEVSVIANNLGGPFVDALDDVTPGTWQGPIRSAFGWHLVFLVERTEASLPSFEAVKARIRDEYRAKEKADLARSLRDQLKTTYTIKVEETP